MEKAKGIILDITSLDRLISELHEEQLKQNKWKELVIALIIDHRLYLYHKHHFRLDYRRYLDEIRNYF